MKLERIENTDYQSLIKIYNEQNKELIEIDFDPKSQVNYLYGFAGWNGIKEVFDFINENLDEIISIESLIECKEYGRCYIKIVTTESFCEMFKLKLMFLS